MPVHADPIAILRTFIDGLDERDTQILEHRFAFERSNKLTLAAIGQRHGITRERVRQLEDRIREGIDSLTDIESGHAVMELADNIWATTGAACPESLAADEIRGATGTLIGEILAYLSGPYHLIDGWFLTDKRQSPDELTREVFDKVSHNGVTDLGELRDGLELAGVIPPAIDPAIDHNTDLRVVHDHVLDTKGGIAANALSWLQYLGHPETAMRLHELMGGGTGARHLGNCLSADPRFHRVASRKWALTEWGGETYHGIVAAMIREIGAADDPIPIGELQSNLSRQFGISKISVQMNANIHPRFVESDGMVRLRRPDEPYVVTQKLEYTRDCFVIDGTWSLRVPVDHDVERGSGRQIPESFADHIGMAPDVTTYVSVGSMEVCLSWGQRPNLGSIRRSVADLGGLSGDIVFVIPATNSELTLHLVKRSRIDAASAAEQICMLVGRDIGDAPSWREILAGALGFDDPANTSIAEITERLEERKDRDMLGRVATLVGSS